MKQQNGYLSYYFEPLHREEGNFINTKVVQHSIESTLLCHFHAEKFFAFLVSQ